jgi:hypothetical protein
LTNDRPRSTVEPRNGMPADSGANAGVLRGDRHPGPALKDDADKEWDGNERDRTTCTWRT